MTTTDQSRAHPTFTALSLPIQNYYENQNSRIFLKWANELFKPTHLFDRAGFFAATGTCGHFSRLAKRTEADKNKKIVKQTDGLVL